MSNADRRAGIDVGGTFTDVVTTDGGTPVVRKVPTTDAPETGVVDGLTAAASAAGFDPATLDFLGHGTTVATNAVLEGEWAETALVTAEGFRDVLEIGRQDRPDLYDLTATKPRPVVERDSRFTVPGRLDERGEELEPLDEEAVREVAGRIRATDAEAVAVSLLFAFENDAHEGRVREVLDAELDVPVSVSSTVLPEMGEYERTLATAVDAGLKPVMEAYLATLEDRLDDLGVTDPLVVTSAGGLVGVDHARRRPVETLLSGPAAGVRGAVHVAERHGHADLLTMDMGGTSCDVAVVRDGEPPVTDELEIGDYRIAVPAVDVHTVGAGGGSVVRVDAGGALRVGPESAGANPGPACYGRGGTRPTTTDAHAVLGRFDPEAALPADLEPSREAAERAIREEVADPLGVGVREAARGILRVADASVERALRVVSVERGHDPRDLALVAFGGAGPLHAPSVARALEVSRVLVPPTAGVLSALGLLVADRRHELGVSRVRSFDSLDPETIREVFADLREEAADRLSEVDPERRRFERFLSMRYDGQTHDLRVPVPDGELDEAALSTVAERFHERHADRYGHAAPGDPLELVAVRLRARGIVEPPAVAGPDSEETTADAVRERREVTFPESGDGAVGTPVYVRSDLPAGATIGGPAVVEGDGTTVAVDPGTSAEVADDGTLLVEVPE